jgi:hypothetical protein
VGEVIISHEHRFIFVKTEKTAGTSIELALSHVCGERDVITPVAPGDEEARRAAGARGPQNDLIPYGAYTPKDWGRLAMRRRRARFYNHASADFIRRHVDDDCWRTYFKFCVERNPWDKVISWYYWSHRRGPRPPLSEFIQSGAADSIRGFDLYSIGGKVAVDRVCRFEDLEHEMKEVAHIIGLPTLPALPHAKGNRRADRRSYRDVLSRSERERIAGVYAREIETLGYRW